MTTLAEALVGVTRLGFDTAPIIYWVEEHPRYLPALAPVFQRLAAQEILCQAFLTNDAALKQVSDIRVLTLDEMEP